MHFAYRNGFSMEEPERELREDDITPSMIDAGVRIWRLWEDSDEPDVRLMIREVLSAALYAGAKP